MNEYLHDVAKLIDLPPRALDFLREILLISEEVVTLNKEQKERICERMGLFSEYKGSRFPNLNLVNQFIQILAKKGAIVKEKTATYRVSELFRNLGPELTLTITYSPSGRTMQLTSPKYGSDPEQSSATG